MCLAKKDTGVFVTRNPFFHDNLNKNLKVTFFWLKSSNPCSCINLVFVEEIIDEFPSFNQNHDFDTFVMAIISN